MIIMIFVESSNHRVPIVPTVINLCMFIICNNFCFSTNTKQNACKNVCRRRLLGNHLEMHEIQMQSSEEFALQFAFSGLTKVI